MDFNLIKSNLTSENAQIIALTGIGILLTAKVFRFILKKAKQSYWQKIADEKRNQRDQQINNFKIPDSGLDDKTKQTILDSDATGIIEMIKSKKITSEQALIVFLERTATVGLEYELITEINFEDALERARDIDKKIKSGKTDEIGLLYGLPMTIKDCFQMKGKDTSQGLASRLNKPAPDDGLMVKILKSEGGVVFTKTNVPQILMLPESTNFIWGRAKNPWDKTRCTGGSSGGEASMIAARCSPLGIGNDIGGSGRIPAFFNGISSLKPFSKTITSEGVDGMGPSLDCILNLPVANAPFAKSCRDINLLMKVLLNNNLIKKSGPFTGNSYHYKREWDEKKVNTFRKGLNIAYVKSEHFFPASPPCQRAVEEAVGALKKAGYTVREVTIPGFEELAYLWFQTVALSDPKILFHDNLKGEKNAEEYNEALMAAEVPQSLRPVIKFAFNLLGQKRKAKLLDYANQLSSTKYLQLIERQKQLQKDVLKYMEDNKIDAFITPGSANPAFKHGTSCGLEFASCYTFVFNLLDFPAGIVPITTVKDGEDVYPDNIDPHRDEISKAEKQNMKGSVGMPVGVQVVTAPHQDEECLNVMIQIEKEIKFFEKNKLPNI